MLIVFPYLLIDIIPIPGGLERGEDARVLQGLEGSPDIVLI